MANNNQSNNSSILPMFRDLLLSDGNNSNNQQLSQNLSHISQFINHIAEQALSQFHNDDNLGQNIFEISRTDALDTDLLGTIADQITDSYIGFNEYPAFELQESTDDVLEEDEYNDTEFETSATNFGVKYEDEIIHDEDGGYEDEDGELINDIKYSTPPLGVRIDRPVQSILEQKLSSSIYEVAKSTKSISKQSITKDKNQDQDTLTNLSYEEYSPYHSMSSISYQDNYINSWDLPDIPRLFNGRLFNIDRWLYHDHGHDHDANMWLHSEDFLEEPPDEETQSDLNAQKNALYEQARSILEYQNISDIDKTNHFATFLNFAIGELQNLIEELPNRGIWLFTPIEKFTWILLILALKYEMNAVKYIIQSPYFNPTMLAIKDSNNCNAITIAIRSGNMNNIKLLFNNKFITIDSLQIKTIGNIRNIYHTICSFQVFQYLFENLDGFKEEIFKIYPDEPTILLVACWHNPAIANYLISSNLMTQEYFNISYIVPSNNLIQLD